MKKIGIFYGSSTGNTQSIAEKIAEKLNVAKADVFDITNTPVNKLEEYDFILLGSSTWGMGDLQDDWDGVSFDGIDLSGKQVAIFGTGDSSSYADSFCDAVGILAEAVVRVGATLVGNKVETADYTYDASVAEVDGFFCGLLLDEDNESDRTDERVDKWLQVLTPSLA